MRQTPPKNGPHLKELLCNTVLVPGRNKGNPSSGAKVQFGAEHSVARPLACRFPPTGREGRHRPATAPAVAAHPPQLGPDPRLTDFRRHVKSRLFRTGTV